MTNPIAAQPGLDAKQRLIEAGLEIFGTFNLEGATTRQLADRAGVNQAAIPYYFGGKEGLYLAVIKHVVGESSRNGILCTPRVNPPRKRRISFGPRSVTYGKSF